MNLPVADLDAALPFYQNILGFRLIERADQPHKSATLGRDEVRMRLAESGGDASQDGCAFHVKGLDALHAELKSRLPGLGAIGLEPNEDSTWRVFYVVAPDGLCYWFGERQP